jgi:sugar transferase (PEP-CTERM/EpsH1 system associated)
MNILYLAHRIPYPPDKGEKIRAFHQIRYLSMKHRVHVASLVDDPDDRRHAKTLEGYCASVDVVYRSRGRANAAAAAALLTDRPLSVASFFSRALSEKIRRRLGSETIDRIFVYSSAMAEYVRDVSGVPKVVDFVDVDSDKWRLYAEHHLFPRSWVYRLEADRLARYEERVARAFDRIIVVSELEAGLLRGRIDGRPVAVISNGVDLDYFRPTGAGRGKAEEPTLVFTGVMDYFPNIDAVTYFCRDIFPGVTRALPGTRLFIVGRNPTPAVRRLGRDPHVIVTGSVPDVRPYLEKAHIAIAPFRLARGVQNKVLEAMAMERPVVGTPQAFQGVQATSEDGIWMEDTAEAFAKAVLALLGDPGLRCRRAGQARRYVETRHQWADHGAQLERLLQDVGV